MSVSFEQALAQLVESGAAETVHQSLRGLEKESLRVSPEGRIAQTPHPKALGAALTHPLITTDYSEAQLELITPTFDDLDQLLNFLTQLHRYVYRNLSGEILWVNSMPCLIEGEHRIPIAYYGESLLGRLKHVYRQGLAHRYGKAMQTISGVHFNYSFTDLFWERYAGPDQSLQVAKNLGYFKILRNFLRVNWWLVLMFGASPAVCNSFFQGRPHHLLVQDNHTVVGLHATSLRMGDLGYQNSRQKDLFICPNSLVEYANSLQHAMRLPDAEFERIGLKYEGDYQQLSTHLLQIENEYYGSMRPKRNAQSLKRPSTALLEQGVEYLEVRLLDLDPFEPIGVSKDQLQIIELVLLYCFLAPSPPMTPAEFSQTRARLQDVVSLGRDPEATLSFNGQTLTIHQQANALLMALDQVADAIALPGWNELKGRMQARLDNVELLPSARILEQLRESQSSFFDWAMARAQVVAEELDQPVCDDQLLAKFEQDAKDSVTKEQALPVEGDFGVFIERFLTA